MAPMYVTSDEAALLVTYRESLSNDRALLLLLLAAWARLSPAQRGAVYRVTDLFVSASRRKGSVATERDEREEGA